MSSCDFLEGYEEQRLVQILFHIDFCEDLRTKSTQVCIYADFAREYGVAVQTGQVLELRRTRQKVEVSGRGFRGRQRGRGPGMFIRNRQHSWRPLQG